MTELYELLKRKQDQLRGREEDWIDYLMDWWRRADHVSLFLWTIMWLHLGVLLGIEVGLIIRVAT